MAMCEGRIADVPRASAWFGHINFTLGVFLDCKWHQFRYCICISEVDQQAVWCSLEPPPLKEEEDKPRKPGGELAEKAPESKPGDAPPVERAPRLKKKYGWNKDPPPPPKNSFVDDFQFYSVTRLLPTSATIRVIDPLTRPQRAVYAEVTFLRWLTGTPPLVVFLRPSRLYTKYKFHDFSFGMAQSPPPPRERL